MLRSLGITEEKAALNLCHIRHPSIPASFAPCPTCRADIVRLVDAPPSAPTGDGMPTVRDSAWMWLRECASPTSGCSLTVRRNAGEVLALLDWATRRQEQGNA